MAKDSAGGAVRWLLSWKLGLAWSTRDSIDAKALTLALVLRLCLSSARPPAIPSHYLLSRLPLFCWCCLGPVGRFFDAMPCAAPPPVFFQVAGIVGSGSLHALEVDTEGAVQEYKEVSTSVVFSESKHTVVAAFFSSACAEDLPFFPTVVVTHVKRKGWHRDSGKKVVTPCSTHEHG